MSKMPSKLAAFFAKKGEKGLAKHENREAMGKEKDTKAIAMKEKRAMKGAPKSLKQYEAKEHKGMGFAKGGNVKRYGVGGMAVSNQMAQPSQAGTPRDMQKEAQMGGMAVSNRPQTQIGGMEAMPLSNYGTKGAAMPPPPPNTAQQDARLQARTAALQGRGVGQKQVDAMQGRMQGRMDARKGGMGGMGGMGAPTQSQMQAQYLATAAPQQVPASMGGFAKGGRVKANGIVRKGKTRGRII